MGRDYRHFACTPYNVQQRFLRGDMIEVFKLLKGFEEVHYHKFFTLTGDCSSTRGHALKLYKPPQEKSQLQA